MTCSKVRLIATSLDLKIVLPVLLTERIVSLDLEGDLTPSESCCIDMIQVDLKQLRTITELTSHPQHHYVPHPLSHTHNNNNLFLRGRRRVQSLRDLSLCCPAAPKPIASHLASSSLSGLPSYNGSGTADSCAIDFFRSPYQRTQGLV